MIKYAPMLQAAKARTLQPVHTIQAEWDNTLGRIKEIAEVIEASQLVGELRTNLTVKRTPHTHVEAIQRVLFQNLLLVPHTRTCCAIPSSLVAPGCGTGARPCRSLLRSWTRSTALHPGRPATNV